MFSLNDLHIGHLQGATMGSPEAGHDKADNATSLSANQVTF